MFWFRALSFAVYCSAPLHCSPTSTYNQFYTWTCQQSALSHLGDFKPKSFSKLNILNPKGRGGRAEIRKHAVFKQSLQFQGANNTTTKGFSVLHSSPSPPGTVWVSACWLPPKQFTAQYRFEYCALYAQDGGLQRWQYHMTCFIKSHR